MKEKFFIFKELWLYLRVRRQWLIFFILLFLVLLGFLLTLAQSPVLAPFIYPLV
jgi:hypothetical protein